MVSILVAAYNCEKTIQACLESIAVQSYSDIEVIVVDDGSKDQTGRICDEFSRKDRRFLVIHQQNSGLSSARNAGLDAAGGQYVTFSDADDLMMPDAVEKLVAKAKCGAELVVGSHWEFRGNHQRGVIRQEQIWNAEDLKKHFSEMDAVLNYNWGKLYLRETIETNKLRFDKTLLWGEDHAFNLAYCKQITIMCTTSEIVYRYRLGGIASSVRYYPNKAELNLTLLKQYEAFFASNPALSRVHLKRVVKQQLESSVAHYLIHCTWACAQDKIEETLCIFMPYINSSCIDGENYTHQEAEHYLTRNTKKIAWDVYRRQYRKITRRKTKKILTGIKNRVSIVR